MGHCARRAVPGLVGPRQFRGHRRAAPRWLHCRRDVLDDGPRVGLDVERAGKSRAAGLRRPFEHAVARGDTNQSPSRHRTYLAGGGISSKLARAATALSPPLQPFRILPRNLRIEGLPEHSKRCRGQSADSQGTPQ